MRSRSFIPYLFITIFILIIIVNAFFFYLANRTMVGVITEDAYEKGLHYNQVIEMESEQQASGFIGMINVEQHDIMQIELLTNKKCDIVKAHMMRTINDKDDMLFELDYLERNVQNSIYNSYVHLFDKPFFGSWFLRIKCYIGEQEYYLSSKITLGGASGKAITQLDGRLQ